MASFCALFHYVRTMHTGQRVQIVKMNYTQFQCLCVRASVALVNVHPLCQHTEHNTIFNLFILPFSAQKPFSCGPRDRMAQSHRRLRQQTTTKRNYLIFCCC